jgi:hypothetical protein
MWIGYSNEYSGSLKSCEFIDKLSDRQILKKACDS